VKHDTVARGSNLYYFYVKNPHTVLHYGICASSEFMGAIFAKTSSNQRLVSAFEIHMKGEISNRAIQILRD